MSAIRTSTGRAPDPVDVHVGRRLRALRKAAGFSQEALANAVGLTFQQVQKYERGSNRVSSSKLYAFAQLIGVAPAAFFEGLPVAGDGEAEGIVAERLELLGDVYGEDLVACWRALNQDQRASLLSVARAIAGAAALGAAASGAGVQLQAGA